MDISSTHRITGQLLAGAELERLPCNLCGREEFLTLAERDAVGTPMTSVLCRWCGLMALNPRPAKAWYERYYAAADGIRREYKSGSRDTGKATGSGFASAARHGRALAERFKACIRPGLTIDVGSAEGGLLSGFGEVIAIQPIGIEPTIERAEFARRAGIKTYATLIENFHDRAAHMPPAATVICTKSLNHLLDPRYFFGWAHDRLEPDGRLMLEVKNFRHQARMSGRIESAIQIDHPFMFTPETLSLFIRAAGFDLLTLDVDEGKSRLEIGRQRALGLPVRHVRLVARKTGRQPFAGPVAREPVLVARLQRQLSPLGLRVHYIVHYATPVRNFFRRLGIKS